ncbi:acyl-CoA dehydrogenase family protein [Luteipulveratus flavus]|uniref:Acyl-CoA/acyl-ACP dehydrogenase n=1 Tax=Luteipulveratus flavus TaxID=3031728 RepID=A0ABT6C6P0_9MICO|nr:acyl-CoA dehydrogenase family protein [Luteipulveratus sp. YIM 133296]MDF8264584.1 acyl-CoA/acyl-ACP dehydrogenase [Luteipulveratus sp. YIM 133296]
MDAPSFGDIRRLARGSGIDAALDVTGPVGGPAVLWARLGFGERLRDSVVDHLRGRRSGDAALITVPTVRAQLTDTLADHAEIEIELRALRPEPPVSTLARLHRRLTDVERDLLRLHGAHGFLAGGIGVEATRSEGCAVAVPVAASAASAPHTRRAEHDLLPGVREMATEWADDFAAHADLVDREHGLRPDAPAGGGLRWMATAGTPADYRDADVCDGHRVDGTTAVERAVVLEELSRGDLGVLMAAPGPSMSGVLIAHLGDQQQRDRFFPQFTAGPTWSCFALTEPGHGSDAASMETRLVGDLGTSQAYLVGEKRYVGGAARARHAVVFARHSGGPLGVGAYLVDATLPQFRAEPLPMLGIRGAQFCAVHLDRVPVGVEDELGRSLPRGRRGLRGAVEVFNRLRPGVAAMALGVAGSALDVLARAWGTPPPSAQDRVADLERRVVVTRELVLRAALVVDETGDGALASIAKARACRLAEHVTREVAEMLGGPAALTAWPALDRAVRAARGIEFMEGTRNIQLLNGFRAVESSRPVLGAEATGL